MDCYIWAIVENGGWDWIKRCLRDRKSRASYGYGIRRFPQKADVLVFYSKKCLHGRIIVNEAGREVTSRDIRKEQELRSFKYVMFLDGRTIRMFHEPVPVKEIADQIEKLKGKTGKSLHAACRDNPKIPIEEYKKIVEKGYQRMFDEIFF